MKHTRKFMPVALLLLSGGLLPASAVQEEAAKSTKIVWLDREGGVKMEFARIKAGTLLIGSDEFGDLKKGLMTLSKDFWVQTTEVTQAQWKAVTGGNPSHFKGEDLPVERVSWLDCQEFMKKLQTKAGEQAGGMTFRLPTEVEWEYACRAGSKGRWCSGDDPAELDAYAWHFGNSEGKTHPVGQKKPNAWGLHDVHGNVWEWCGDWHTRYYKTKATDPQGPVRGVHRILRGGSWGIIPRWCGASYRNQMLPWFKGRGIGLRVVLR